MRHSVTSTYGSGRDTVYESLWRMSEDMRADIAAAWGNLSNKIGKKRDIRKLPEYLNGGEVVLAMTGGLVAGKNGLLVATDRRALFIAEGIMNHSFEDFPYDRITGVTSSRGMVFGKIVIATAGASRVVDQVDKGEAEAVAAILRERVEATTRERYAPPPGPFPTPPPPPQYYSPPHHARPPQHYVPPHTTAPNHQPAPAAPAAPQSTTGFSVAAELRELASLRDEGVLTNEEFEEQKARLLRR